MKDSAVLGTVACVLIVALAIVAIATGRGDTELARQAIETLAGLVGR